MLPRLAFMHRNTPKLRVMEPRGMNVRSVEYCRAVAQGSAEVRVERTMHDLATRSTHQWDPRLFQDASTQANLSSMRSMSGAVLCTVSVDAGVRVSLYGEAGQPVHRWDGMGSQCWMHYDCQVRLSSLFEQPVGEEAVCAERLSYAANAQAFADHNQCGRLVHHHDPAGELLFSEYALTGSVVEQTRRFLSAVVTPDWPEPVADRKWQLEPGEGATTRSRFNPSGVLIEQTDAGNHRQYFGQTIAGQLREVRFQLSGDPIAKTIASAIQYNADGKAERETAGNGVTTWLHYQPEDGRLARLVSLSRQNDQLQDLIYDYDPSGNVLSIQDAARPVQYFANQRIDAASCYVYNSLYQVVNATGWESGSNNKGPHGVMDPLACANYRQTYRYDRGSNLLELTHEGLRNYGHRLVAAAQSNRCLAVHNGVEPGEEDFLNGFDGNGNELQPQPGQTLMWNSRNQLRQVQPVERGGGLNDRELYIYGGDGMRVRKISELQTCARKVVAEVRYLGSLELRTHSGTGKTLQVINIKAGHGTVQVVRLDAKSTHGNSNDTFHYCVTNHLGSCSLELDSQARVISRETYYPFGMTASCKKGDSPEESQRTRRYSGKEMDATGFYYYGFRYYMPGQQRWLNPDPAGDVDGMNGYVMVKNNPVTNIDVLGLSTVAALFEELRESVPAVYELAVELDRYFSLQKDIMYARYREVGDRHVTIQLLWEIESKHFTPNEVGAVETDSGLLSEQFVKDIHRNDYSLSRSISDEDEHRYKENLQSGASGADKINTFIALVPNEIDRARVSEIASQVFLAELASSPFYHVTNEGYSARQSSDTGRAAFEIEFLRHEVVVSASTEFKIVDTHKGENIPGLSIRASAQTKIGRNNRRLSHDALPHEPVINKYELTFVRPRPQEPKTSVVSRFFGSLKSTFKG